MSAFLWILLLFPHLALVVAVKFSNITSPVSSGSSLEVNWTPDPTDPSNWSLYLQVFSDTTEERHFHLKNETTWTSGYNVTIPTSAQGCARLVASNVSYFEHSYIGHTNNFTVQDESTDPLAAAQSTGQTSGTGTDALTSSQPATGGPTPSEGPRVTSAPTNQPESKSKSKSKSKIPIIVGATVGAFVLIIGAVVLVVFIRWRRSRSSSPRQIIFNRELMFQRRPSPDEAKGWTVRSVDAEKGITNDGAQVFVPKIITEDSSL